MRALAAVRKNRVNRVLKCERPSPSHLDSLHNIQNLVPGKHWVTVEFLLPSLIIESPITNVDGGGGGGVRPDAMGKGDEAGQSRDEVADRVRFRQPGPTLVVLSLIPLDKTLHLSHSSVVKS